MKKMKVLFLLALTCASLIGCQAKDTSSGSSKKNEKTHEQEKEPDGDSDLPVNPEETPENDERPEPEYEEVINEDSTDGVGENHDAIQELVQEKQELLGREDTFGKTNDVYEINKQIADLNTYDFSNIKITFLGDSLTFGQGGDYNEYNNRISYVDYVREILGCKTVNLGVSGACMGSYNGYDGVCYKVELIPEDTDIIFLFAGINDFFFGESYFGDDNYEEGTYMGDTRRAFSYVKDHFPDKPVYIVLIYQNSVETSGAVKSSYSLNDYLQVQRQLANEYGFRVIDFYQYNFMNNQVIDNLAKYFDDTIHPNNTGYMWIGRYIAAEIVQDYN